MTSSANTPRLLVTLGISGGLIVLCLNCFAYYLMKSPHAIAFQGQWWSVWYAHYVVWLSFTLIGGTAWFIAPKAKPSSKTFQH